MKQKFPVPAFGSYSLNIIGDLHSLAAGYHAVGQALTDVEAAASGLQKEPAPTGHLNPAPT